ncbi:MAG: amidohydrolase [Deltaproteobacteria bacterium]|nr:MAG: amidohydrolase [Deltaproteobacteria bacterium]
MTGARDIRAQLSHPVIDADGHQLEFEPLLLDYLRDVGGGLFAARAQDALRTFFGWYELTPSERRAARAVRPPWGLQTTRPDDIAACMVPALFRRNMDELGIDYAIVYPTLGVPYVRFAAPELRSAVCRAINQFYADNFRDHADRLAPAAMIPMTTPGQAIAELEHAVGLGLKVIVIDCAVPRPIEALAPLRAQVSPGLARVMTWLDTFGVDSELDYDPFWARCVELGVSPTAHMAGLWGTRTGEALCKSLFLAGVTFRFPRLQVALLEGGASWACSLYADLIGHWEKRNLAAIEAYDPGKLDRDRLVRALREHGGERYARLLERPLDESCRGLFLLSGWVPEAGWAPRDPALLDEFARCPIAREDDIRDHFVDNFFFGCEAEDPSVGWALDGRLPMGAQLRVMFGSDIGHWDVTDMRSVLAEAHELVERGHVSPDGFRAFTFDNAVRLHGRHNPGFFRGTSVERAAAAVLEAEPR